MEKQIELSKEEIEEIVDSSDMNLSQEQRTKKISNLQNGKKSLSTLIMNSDIKSLQDLIDEGVNVNEKNVSGVPPLATAILYSDIDIVKLLIENGADVNITVEHKPLLVYASMFGDMNIIKLLIENGADVDSLVNDTPLIFQTLMFGNNELVKLLIENGASIEFNNHSSLLEQALLFSNIEIVELCIEKGSQFSPDILFDIVKVQDGYIFNRKQIENMIYEKNKIYEESYSLEEDMNKLIQSKKSTINMYERSKNSMHEMKNRANEKNLNKIMDDFIIHIDKSLEETNNEIIKSSQELNKLHNRLNKLRSNTTKIINNMNDVQDRMTLLTIIDFLKIFIKYGGDINYKDEHGSTALMFLSYLGYEDCVKLLIENGAEIDIQNSGIETPLSLAYDNNHFNIVKLLIDSGADVNITMDNGESFYKKVKHDKNYEVLEWIKNSSTYIKITHDPKALVKLLSNFTIDKPIKYTTHVWDFGELKKEYGDFDGYMSAVKKQFESMKSELEELSPNLYKKIYTFLLESNPDKNYSWCSKTDINIGWSSLDGLKEHCDSGKNPFNFRLPKAIRYKDGFKTIKITTFEEVINLFKQEIEIRENFKNLSTLFINQQKKLDDTFELDLSTSKLGRQFYTDTQKFSSLLDKIFADMGTRKENPNITVNTTELEDRSIEIKITQLDSNSSRSATELLERSKEAGDIFEIKESLTNLCDWSVESSYEDEDFRVNFLHSDNIKEIVQPKTKPKGFTHILRFYI